MESRRYRPAVRVVSPGSSVRFPNYDPFRHNVFSDAGPGRFDLARWRCGRRGRRRIWYHRCVGRLLDDRPVGARRVVARPDHGVRPGRFSVCLELLPPAQSGSAPRAEPRAAGRVCRPPPATRPPAACGSATVEASPGRCSAYPFRLWPVRRVHRVANRRRGLLGKPRGRPFATAPPPRRYQRPGGEQRGEPSHVSPSHPAQKRRVAACPPPVHFTLMPWATPVRPRAGAEAAAIVPRSMARLYDLMVLYDPTAPDERRAAAISEVESLIGSGGELLESYDWGTRRMAYEIDHRPEAEYRLYQLRGDNALLERLNQRLRILDGVLRFRIIKIKPGMSTPPPPEHQAPRRREEREPQDTRVAARAAADAPAGE